MHGHLKDVGGYWILRLAALHHKDNHTLYWDLASGPHDEHRQSHQILSYVYMNT